MESAAPRFPRFSGGFKTFRFTEHTNHEQGVKAVFLVYSSGSRTVFLRHLWLKFLWDELTQIEFALLITAKEIISNDKMYNALRAKNILTKKILRKRIIEAELSIEGKVSSGKESYLGSKRIRYEVHRTTKKLPKPPKYSGYVKSPSSVGTKSPGSSSFLEAATDPTLLLRNEIVFDWYSILTVGKIEFSLGDLVFYPDDDPKKDRNGD